MKKIFTALSIILILLWVPYFVQTYNLKTLTASDLPTEGAWVSLEQGNLYYRWYYPEAQVANNETCLLYTSPSPRDQRGSRMPSSA